mmetsp:Transcript_18031/g.60824  ORF Transcript_18031/g.60824 Transcript_18031/m.60824 type:complete len:109 (+) Transcript_18031:207-533(+)
MLAIRDDAPRADVWGTLEAAASKYGAPEAARGALAPRFALGDAVVVRGQAGLLWRGRVVRASLQKWAVSLDGWASTYDAAAEALQAPSPASHTAQAALYQHWLQRRNE